MSPIKGWSEKRRLHRLGKVRLGEKKISKGGKEYPSALDHFSFVDAPDLLTVYGDKCKEIDVMLPNENVDAFFPQFRMCYRTSGLFCRGDGETATRVNVGMSEGPNAAPLDPEGHKFIIDQGIKADVGDMFEMPCAGESCHFTERKFCKPIGRFLFLVPKAPRVGVFEISTTSWNSILELNSSIDTIRGIAGRVSMIPLRLKLVPKDTKVPKSTMKKTIYHLVLEFNGSFSDLAQYRGVKEIPMDQLPPRHELEQHVPEDLMPHGGEDLESHLEGTDKIADPVESVIVDPVSFHVVKGGVSKLKTTPAQFKIKTVGGKDYFTLSEKIATDAKNAGDAGRECQALLTQKDGAEWIDRINVDESTTPAGSTF